MWTGGVVGGGGGVDTNVNQGWEITDKGGGRGGLGKTRVPSNIRDYPSVACLALGH
jgi:hypothetical protein